MWFVMLVSFVGRIWAWLTSFRFAKSRHEIVHSRILNWCAHSYWSVEVEPNDMGPFGSQWVYTIKGRGNCVATWCDESSMTIDRNWLDFLEFMTWVVEEGSKPPMITEG